MKKCRFIFCLHNHQPVGNFDHVFEWGFRDCYDKTLQVLREYPEFRFAVHNSGPLLEWIEERHPEYIETLSEMRRRGQVEIIGGGFYEPIFSIISENDIRGQISMMQQYCEKRFGAKPEGFWTAERVWDPEIPRLVSDLGLDYTILDDNHFRYAGIEEDELYGYYITERLDRQLKVFPIDRFLRYSIPFRLPAETIDYFKSVADRRGECAFLYGDDGEKFGMWPGTFKWVFEEKWLVNFVEAVLREDWIDMTLPSEYVRENAPLGRVYLTQGSYYELSEWALPSPVASRLIDLHKEIKGWNREKDFYPFLKGGVWNNFLNKYPESNALNKRTLLVSGEIQALECEKGIVLEDARRELYKSECNCAYWHGLFGGIYLSSLRHALHHNILAAEGRYIKALGLKGVEVIDRDIWNEGTNQILLRRVDMAALIVPAHGGALAEFGVYSKRFDILAVIPRRYEAYHETLKQFDESEEQNGDVKSIHDMVVVKEKGLKDRLVYDACRRYSFKDLFLRTFPSVEDLMYGRADIIECGGLPYSYSVEKKAKSLQVPLERRVDFDGRAAVIRKTYSLSGPAAGVKAVYSIAGAAGTLFGVELNINLLAAHDEDRFYEIPGLAKEDSFLDFAGLTEGINAFALVDRYSGIRVSIGSSRAFSLMRYPIYTVSQSDRGFEKNYQGASLFLVYVMKGDPEGFDLTLSVEGTSGR